MKRVVIRLDKEEFETLKVFKELTGLTWKDFLLKGFSFWYKELDIEKKFEKIKTLKEDKN